MIVELWQFYQDNFAKLLSQLLEHIQLTAISVVLACLISIPLGIWISRQQKAASVVLNITGILQTIPSIALLGFLIPFLGIGVKPAIFALFLYSLLPIVRNVYTGLTDIDPAIIESARGMGMSALQILFKVKIPLALPTIFAGIRTATVINVGVATLAAYIAAGGLGEFIFGGIALNNSVMIVAGALPAALLAITLDFGLGLLQKGVQGGFTKSLPRLLLVLVIFIALGSINWSGSTKLRAAFPPEFVGRRDGLPALRQKYNLHISNVVIAPALMYQAVAEKHVDVISGYSTDGRIKSYQLQTLKDDKNAFPPYQAALLIRKELFQQIDGLDSILSKLDGQISDSAMTSLNYQVDENKIPVKKVAQQFLKERHLLGNYQGPRKRELTIASKIFTEQYILSEMYKLLLESHLPISVTAKKGLGGTKICFDALVEGAIDLYPEYSGTALQVLLKMQYQPEMSSQKLFKMVQDSLAHQNLYLSPALGFNNTYALMMRKEQAKKLKIQTISDLQEYLQEPLH